MRISSFAATADIVGRRVVVSWDVVPEDGETLADAPGIVLRRKHRDFEFPAPPAGPGAADPFAVYDSGAFPPPGGTVTEIDLGGTLVDGVRTTTVAESVAAPVDGRMVEVLRRTRVTTVGPDGQARRHERILDVGGSPNGLPPRVPCYYQLSASAGLPPAPAGPPRAIATPTELYGSGRALYELIPSIYRRHDVVSAPVRDAGAVPEASPANGQLRRFVDLFGSGLDHLRGRADGLVDLHDVDEVDARLLPHLARWVGWDLSYDEPIPQQRHEVRYAAQLYRITGTVPGCMLWAKRLTGWDVRVKEMWRNVLVTNDVGNPDDPDDPGSRTVDTSSPAALAAIGTADDVLDYTYDTGTGPEAIHAFNVVAFYATPDPGQTVDDVARLRGRLLTSSPVFLPFNLRAALVLEVPVDRAESRTDLGLTTTTDPGV